ncbi:MAG: class I SAM-dependent methyltransferase [Synechococcus sp.]
MTDKQLNHYLFQLSSDDLENRKRWYSPAAEAYSRARPLYPPDVIDRVMEVTQLSSRSHMLEVGCGPATATRSFAPFGINMLCLEPNPEFFRLAQQHCQPYPNVKFENLSFEEWPLEENSFDTVLAASSFHWIPAEIAYPKAADALKENGHLILFWNKELQPTFEVYQSLSSIYQRYVPSLDRHEDKSTQIDVFQQLGHIVLEYQRFTDLVFGYVESQMTYPVDRYLMLLNSYSPYLQLEAAVRDRLFVALKDTIERDYGGRLRLWNLCGFHIARKMS